MIYFREENQTGGTIKLGKSQELPMSRQSFNFLSIHKSDLPSLLVIIRHLSKPPEIPGWTKRTIKSRTGVVQAL